MTTCGKMGCPAPEEQVAQVSVAPGLAIFACSEHVQALRRNPDIEALCHQLVRIRRRFEVYVEALKGPAAHTPNALDALDKLIAIEDQVKAAVTAWLLSAGGRPS